MEQPASESQLKFITQLANRYRKQIPDLQAITKQEAKVLIQEWLEEDEIGNKPKQYSPKTTYQPQVVSYGKVKPKSDGKFTTMFVSYAKDIFIALTPVAVAEGRGIDNAMDQAIDLVKRARTAFE